MICINFVLYIIAYNIKVYVFVFVMKTFQLLFAKETENGPMYLHFAYISVRQHADNHSRVKSTYLKIRDQKNIKTRH